MSYEIVYSRAFIKTTRGIIPLILTGSNNCYEYIGRGRERRERDWSMFWGNKHVEMDEQDLLTAMADYSAGTNDTFCKFRGGWVNAKDVYKFYKQGIKGAHTIEDWIENGRQKKRWRLSHLSVCVSDWSGGYDNHFNTKEKTITTTADLEAWIDEAKEYIKGRNSDVFMCFNWGAREPITYLEQKEIKGACCLKDGKRYLEEASDTSSTWTGYKNNALVFENIEQANEYIGTHKALGYRQFKIVNYTSKKEPPKNCYVYIEGHGIFARFTRCGYRYSYSLYDGLYMTEKCANSVVEKIKNMFGSEIKCSIKKVAIQ